MAFFAPLIRWRYHVTGGFRQRRFAFFGDTLGQYAGTCWWLDLGGGPGSYLLTQLETLPGTLPRVVLLDRGEAELRDAQGRFPTVPCLCADGEHLPFRDRAFDLVFCNSVLEHVPLPFFRNLPRPVQRWMCRLAGASWDYLMSVRYVTEAELRALFPHAQIMRERAFGLTKSFYALTREDA